MFVRELGEPGSACVLGRYPVTSDQGGLLIGASEARGMLYGPGGISVEKFVANPICDGVISASSREIMSITARPVPSTSVCFMLPRNARCVCMNIAINPRMMNASSATVTRISMREKASTQRRTGAKTPGEEE